jgi:hypothetical protein
MPKKTFKMLCLALALAMTIACCPGCSLLLSGSKSWSFGAEETADLGETAVPESVEPTQNAVEATPEVSNTVTFAETALLSTDECAVTALSFDPDAFWGPMFTFLLENNTDKTLMFCIEDASVNGVMCDPFWACQVEPGKKANSEVSWMEDTLADCGINYLEHVEFKLRVYDSEDWSVDDLFSGIVTLEVENTSALPPVSEVVYESGYPQQTILDNEQFMLTLKNYEPVDEWGAVLVFFIVNKTDKNLMFSGEDVSVNGVMCDPYWASEVASGKSAYCEVTWMTASLQKCGINYLSEVELTLRVYDADDWTADDLYRDNLVIQLYGPSSLPPVSEVVYTHGFAEQTLVDNGEIAVIARDFNPEGEWGPTLVLYIENNTDKTLTFSMEGVSVNDFMCDPYWICEVSPGKVAYSEVSWMSSAVEANGISAFEKVDFTLRVYDSVDWYADDILNETFQLTF